MNGNSEGGQMLVLAVLLSSGLSPFAIASERTLYTLYSTPVSWNTAKNVCWSNGGRLAVIANDVTVSVLQGFKRNEWISESTPYWIGLYQPEGGSFPNTWSGQCSTLTGQGGWDTGEPDDGVTNRCTTAEFTSGAWSTKICSEKFSFICETWEDFCYYETEMGVYLDKFTTAYQTVSIVGLGSTSQCTDYCDTRQSGDSVCLAAAYNTLTRMCRAYFGSSPTDIAGSTLRISQASTTLYKRVCYQGLLNTGAIPADLIDDSVEPQRPCYEYADKVQLPIPSTSSADGTLSSTSENPSTTTSDTDPTVSPTVVEPRFSSVSDQNPTGEEISTDAQSPVTTDSVQRTPVSSTSIASETTSTTEATATPPHEQTTGTHGTETKDARVTTSSENTSTSGATTLTDEQTAGTIGMEIKDATVTEPLQERICWCPCSVKKPLSPKQASAFISNIIQELSVPTANTSAHRRKYVSVVEDRPVANALGYLGTGIMVVVFGGLFLLDLPALSRDIKMLVHRLRSCRKAN